MSKTIKEVKSRQITETDRKNFAKYEEMFTTAELNMLHGVDMTPQSYDWQEVDRVDLDVFCNKPLSALHGEIDKLVETHGAESIMRVHSYESGGGWSMRTDTVIPSTTYYALKVFKNLPVWTQEQRYAKLQQSAIEYEERSRERSKRDRAQLAKLVKKLKVSDVVKTLHADDPQAKQIKEMHERIIGKKKKK
jgi:hypothetical protein